MSREMPQDLYVRCMAAFAEKHDQIMTVKKIYDIQRHGCGGMLYDAMMMAVTIVCVIDHIDLRDGGSDTDGIMNMFIMLMRCSYDAVDDIIMCIRRFASRCHISHRHDLMMTIICEALRFCPCRAIREVLFHYGAELDPNPNVREVASMACAFGMSDKVRRLCNDGHTLLPVDMIHAVYSGDAETIKLVAGMLGDRRVLSAGTNIRAHDLDVPLCELILELGIIKYGVIYDMMYIKSTDVLKWLDARNILYESALFVVPALVSQDYRDALKHVLKRGRLNSRVGFNSFSSLAFDFNTSLHCLDTGVLDMLIEHFAYIDHNNGTKTVLHRAPLLVRCLIEHGYSIPRREIENFCTTIETECVRLHVDESGTRIVLDVMRNTVSDLIRHDRDACNSFIGGMFLVIFMLWFVIYVLSCLSEEQLFTLADYVAWFFACPRDPEGWQAYVSRAHDDPSWVASFDAADACTSLWPKRSL